MSIKLMQLVWDTELPQSRKFLLLSLADQANDAGECWPSFDLIAQRCSMGRRTVFDSLADLEAAGWLERIPRGNQRVSFRLNLAKLQQLTLGQCGIRTGAKSAQVRPLHGCESSTGANSGKTGAGSAPHKATPSNSNHGGTRTRAEQLDVMGSYDRSLVDPYLGTLPASIEVQLFADFLKHCQVKRGPMSISAWKQTQLLLEQLASQGVDLNESLRETMQLQLVKPVDPRHPARRGGAPPRPRANDDLTKARYDDETAHDDLPAELRTSGTGTDG